MIAKNTLGPRELSRQRAMRAVEMIRQGKPFIDAVLESEVSPQRVRSACNEAGVAIPRKPRTPNEASDTQVVLRSEWESADWTLRDSDLAKHFGVTRERVRQVRKLLGKDRSPHHRKQTSTIEFRKWASKNRESIHGLPLKEILSLSPIRLSTEASKRILANMGIDVTLPISIAQSVTKENLKNFTTERQFRSGMTACWEWNFGTPSAWYPRIGRDYAHHFVFEMFHGVPDGNLQILHRCDNRRCVNPDHLYQGSPADNVADRVRHQTSPRTFLSAEDIAEIRRQFAVGGDGNSSVAIAERFGKSNTTIWNIIKQRTYCGAARRRSDRIDRAMKAVSKLPARFMSRDLAREMGCPRPEACSLLYVLGRKKLVRQVRARRATVGAVYELTAQKMQLAS